MVRWLFFGWLISACLPALAIPQPVQAEGVVTNPSASPRITLRASPVIVEDEAAPGETIRSTVTLENLSDFFLPVRAFASDVYSDDDSGNLSIVHDAGKLTARSWFHTEPPDMILDPKTPRKILVEIEVPKNAEPGGRYVSVFFNTFTPPGEPKPASNFVIQSQIGVLFFLTVKGNITSAGRLARFSTAPLSLRSPVNFNLAVENSGNVHLRPQGTVKVSRLGGKEVGKFNVEDQGSLTALPGKIRSLRLKWEVPSPPIGIYKAQVELRSGPAVTLRGTRWFMVIYYPILFLLVIIGLVGWTVGKRTLVRKKRRR